MPDDTAQTPRVGTLLALAASRMEEEREDRDAAEALEAMREAQLPRPSESGEGWVFHKRDHAGMARRFVADYYPAGLAYHELQWWSCNNETSIWKTETQESIESAILDWLADQWYLSSGLERKMVGDTAVSASVFTALRSQATTGRKPTPGVPLADRLLTHGLLGKRIEPSDFVTWNLSLRYSDVESAPTPTKILEFLHTGLEPGSPVRFRPEDVQLIREFFGYCLTAGNAYQKGLWLQGATRNGKSLALNLLLELLGEANAVPRTVQDFKDAANNDLLGKQLVYMADYRPAGADANQRALQFLLNVIGDDPIRVRTLHVGAQKVKLRAKCIVVSNFMVNIKDTAGAVAERFIPIVRQGPTVKAQDPHLLGKLREELPGFLKWCLEGLADLQARRGFDLRLIDPKVRHATLRSTMPVLAFLEDRCALGDSKAWTAWPALFKAWELYAASTGHFRNLNMEEFRTGVEAAASALGVTLLDQAAKGQPGVYGVVLPEYVG